jgi:hypothetical protein
MGRLAQGESISFELSSTQIGETLDTADRDVGGQTTVVPLFEVGSTDATAWVSWNDEWEKTGVDEHLLTTVSMTFFWGVRARYKRQLLRAEWDPPQHGAARAGQPHWHIDASVWARSVLQGEDLAAGALAEFAGGDLLLEGEVGAAQEESGPQLPISRMHLAMGGWQNAPRHPEWWQYAMPRDWPGLERELSRWVERTLQLAVDQFGAF